MARRRGAGARRPATRRSWELPRRSLAVVLAAVALVAPACGARWSDEQRETVLARGGGGARIVEQGSGAVAGPATNGGSVATSTTARPGVAAPGGDASVDPTGTGATNRSPSAGDPGRLPCAAVSDAPGVSDTTITIGTINSLSGPVPGLGESHLAATRAHVEYRNANGGVCGRQVVLQSADDGNDNGRFRSLVVEMNPRVLGLIGGVAGAADGGKEIIEAERIPVVGTAITELVTEAPTYFGLRPPLPDYDVVTPKYQYLHDEGVRTAAVVYVAAASAPREATQREKPLMQAAGIRIVLERALPLTNLSYDGVARAVANSGADYLLFIYDEGASASMAKAMADTGYELMFEEYIVAYGSRFVELAGAAAEGASNWISMLPAEDGPGNGEHEAFLEWLQRTAPGVGADPFAGLGWAGTKAFLDSVEALPGPIGREALVEQVRGTGTYDADGMIAPIELGAQVNLGCFVAMIVESGAWRRLMPSEGFLCP